MRILLTYPLELDAATRVTPTALAVNRHDCTAGQRTRSTAMSPPPSDHLIQMGGGGLRTPAEDLAAFGEALIEPGPLKAASHATP